MAKTKEKNSPEDILIAPDLPTLDELMAVDERLRGEELLETLLTPNTKTKDYLPDEN